MADKKKPQHAPAPPAPAPAPAPAPEVIPDAPAPEMSLEQAGAILRGEINAHRAKLLLYGAVESAMTAKQALAQLETKRQGVLTSLAAAEERKSRLDAQVEEATKLLGNVNGQLADAKKALDALTAETVNERKRGEAERQTQEGKHRALLAEQARELLAAQAKTQEARDKLADLVAPFVRPVSVEA